MTMSLLGRFKARYHRSGLAALWHRLAPAVTISRTFYGVKVFMDTRDNIDDLTRSKSELENRERAVLDLPRFIDDGLLWDVGANIGLFSVRAATLGKPCVAFELSPKSAYLLEKTRSHNKLSYTIVARPMTIEAQSYTPPVSASAENKFDFDPESQTSSISYLEAAIQYGLPKLIKMDIEGGEESFFKSAEFKQWIIQHNIIWLVEVHHRQLGYTPEWQDVPHYSVGEEHVIYAADEKLLSRIMYQLHGIEE
jgi:FkbM family methyltransferase